jgi:hypothetical protein
MVVVAGHDFTLGCSKCFTAFDAHLRWTARLPCFAGSASFDPMSKPADSLRPPNVGLALIHVQHATEQDRWLRTSGSPATCRPASAEWAAARTRRRCRSIGFCRPPLPPAEAFGGAAQLLSHWPLGGPSEPERGNGATSRSREGARRSREGAASAGPCRPRRRKLSHVTFDAAFSGRPRR